MCDLVDQQGGQFVIINWNAGGLDDSVREIAVAHRVVEVPCDSYPPKSLPIPTREEQPPNKIERFLKSVVYHVRSLRLWRQPGRSLMDFALGGQEIAQNGISSAISRSPILGYQGDAQLLHPESAEQPTRRRQSPHSMTSVLDMREKRAGEAVSGVLAAVPAALKRAGENRGVDGAIMANR